jgi:hypothetical protein
MIDLLVALIVLGVVLYLVNLIPMAAWVKQVINVLAILYVVLYCLQVLGVWHGMPSLRG